MSRTGHNWRLPLSVVILAWLIPLLAGPAHAAPPRKGKLFGPCIGMDCLHGVLMHGDAKSGDAHAVEDAEKRREELDRLEAKDGSAKPGQMNQEEFMHGVLMHGDASAGGTHDHGRAPTVDKRPEQSGPMDQEALMHGMLMHGDSDPAHMHQHDKADKAALKASAKGASGGLPGVEMRPAGDADDSSGLLGRWWRKLVMLVTGGGEVPQVEPKAADYNTLQDMAAVGSTKAVSELERTAGHSHRDGDQVHRERDRREHASKVHIEH